MGDIQVADELIGTLIDGRYRVLDRLARGGTATVYTAEDERLERTVALKIIHPSQAAEPRFLGRFTEEARAVARLTHPNVVAAYDQGSHDGLPYLVTEYVHGRTLREILRSRRRLTPVEALAITEQMLAAISAAHRAGLVHRDVKPENVLVAEAPSAGTTNLVESVIKVTDFGLAQAVRASAAGGDPGGPAGRSLPATVAYVPPEVVASGRADPRSDVYSTGIVLFEMLTGRVPYEGGEPTEVAWRHVDEEVPPPSRFVAGLPPALDELVRRATQREPSARPSDAGALMHEVQLLRERLTTSAVRPRTGDATVVMSALPTSGPPPGSPPPASPPGASPPGAGPPGTDRPGWARLPAPRARSAPGARRATVRTTRPTESWQQPAGWSPDDEAAVDPTVTRRRRAIAASFLAVLVLLVALGGWWFGFGRWVPAPEVVGMPEAEAVALAQQAGLRVEFAEPEFNNDVAAGHVLSQDPGDRVVRGGTLTLTLSRGPEVYPVPDVIGANVDVATRQLEDLGLVVTETEPEYSDTVPTGRVLTTDPPVGEDVEPGDEVALTASKGRAPIDVPSLVGKQVDQASNELAQLGLTAEVERVESEEPEGTVVGQDPAANTGAESGDTVTLEVSQGPPTRQVPDVQGRPCEQAEDILTDAGFEVAHFGFQRRGRVAVQNPSAGTGLPPGSEVTIFCT